MKRLKKNILNKKDKNIYTLSIKRVIWAAVVLIVVLFIITFINGAMVHKGV